MDNGICPAGTHELIDNSADCELAHVEVGGSALSARVVNWKKSPKGCWSRGNSKLYFNKKGKTGSTNKKKVAICCTIPLDNDYNYGAYAGYDDDSNACKCKASWQFDGAAFEQCAFTPDDPNNSWCYTEAACEGSSESGSYAGENWAYCNVKDNKRASFGVKHKKAASAVAGAAASADGGADGGASAAASTAGGIAAAMLVVGALVVVVVRKRRAAPQGRNVDDQADTADGQLEDGGIANLADGGIPSDAADSAVDGLDRTDSYHEAQTEVNPADFAAAQFVLDADATGSFKVKSVRRPNPAYRSSAYIENADTEGI